MTATVHVSFFKDPFATSMTTADLTLEELRTRILTASAPTKAALPWLKLAIFGKKRTPKREDGSGGGSLRHDGNVLQITGAELDYDGEKVGFDEALEMVKAMGITALIYTSPSHTAATPRWRILAPTSKPCPNVLRAALVARMNGFMNGILGKHVESFTLSQAYYFGQAKSNAQTNHMAVVVYGQPIDLSDDLLAFEEAGRVVEKSQSSNEEENPFEAIGLEKKGKKSDGAPKDHSVFESILKEMGDGPDLKGFNDPLTRAVSNYVGLHNGHRFDHNLLKKLLREAIAIAPKGPTRSADDITRYNGDKYLDDIIASAIRKFIQDMPISLNDFIAHAPDHSYIFLGDNATWKGSAINTRIKPVPMLNAKGQPKVNPKTGKASLQKPTDWLDLNRSVEQMTWAPGEPQVILGKMMVKGAGWVRKKGVKVFNLYYPPVLEPGDPRDALPWINHLQKVYPDDWRHITSYLAHRVQRPGEKVNHALLFGGNQGIGKDTILEPVRRAIGPWNFREVNPTRMFDQYNPYLRAVILRINEVRDLGDVGRFSFYDHIKTITASPPDTFQINDKYLAEHNIVNCCGVVMTTNYKTDGLYLPPDDRRTYVAWSPLERDVFPKEYWADLWDWYDRGGDRHVMAYLRHYDISAFRPKAPPPQTDAFHAIVNANTASDDDDVADALEELGRPNVVSWDSIEQAANPTLARLMEDKDRYKKRLGHRLESQGYVAIVNPDRRDGAWDYKAPLFGAKDPVRRRIRLYGKASFSTREIIPLARAFLKGLENDATAQSGDSSTNSNVRPIRP